MVVIRENGVVVTGTIEDSLVASAAGRGLKRYLFRWSGLWAIRVFGELFFAGSFPLAVIVALAL